MVAFSNKYNFVYLKTRKTASTSIEMYLQPLCTPTGTPVEERTRTIYSDAGIIGSRLVKPKDMEPLDRKFRAHMYTSILKTELGDEKWSNVIKLTSVRNPFDKVLSNFLWNRRRSKMPPAESLNEEIQEFRDYVRAQAWKADRPIVFIDKEFQPTCAIRYENIETDLSKFLEIIGAKDDLPALHVTKRTSSERRAGLIDYYNKECAGIVRKRLSWVFRKYDYPRTIRGTQDALEARLRSL